MFFVNYSKLGLRLEYGYSNGITCILSVLQYYYLLPLIKLLSEQHLGSGNYCNIILRKPGEVW